MKRNLEICFNYSLENNITKMLILPNCFVYPTQPNQNHSMIFIEIGKCPQIHLKFKCPQQTRQSSRRTLYYFDRFQELL